MRSSSATSTSANCRAKSKRVRRLLLRFHLPVIVAGGFLILRQFGGQVVMQPSPAVVVVPIAARRFPHGDSPARRVCVSGCTKSHWNPTPPIVLRRDGRNALGEDTPVGDWQRNAASAPCPHSGHAGSCGM